MVVPYRKSKNGLAVEVKVQPRSSKAAIESIEGGVLKVRLTAPPHGGEANAQLIEVLSSAFGTAKSGIKILRGHSSRNKVVELRDEGAFLRWLEKTSGTGP